ncbi:MAG: RpiB/LacA/LacB family sugar-phosphate isomerase [Bacteroidales bacterium]|nr:RpiB/LacA/LacB family sugar-phosphate isomerase [Bacteroidales bacterium]
MKRIGLCADHAGYEMKNRLISYLLGKGYEVVNFGTDGPESMDYPDVAHPLAKAVEHGTVDAGIAFCGTGEGMAMTLNKHQGIRAGLAWNPQIAALTRQHNDANVLVMPARFISWRMVTLITARWLATPFEGGRHQRRIDKMPAGKA